MSRVGTKPVVIPKGVTVIVSGNVISVKGGKGELSQTFTPEVDVRVTHTEVVVSRMDETKRSRAMHGLYRKLLENMITGVSQGFNKTLLINGVGYRAEVKGSIVTLNLGFSNPIEYAVPKGIQVDIEGNNKVTVSGVSRELVGQTASEIRGLRPPEPYKGKGIRYENEHVRRKVGKAGVS